MPTTRITLRTPDDLAQLGAFVRAARHAAGFASARAAAPLLDVTPRLLAEVERGMRTKRGITAGALLSIVAGLGYEVEIRPRERRRAAPADRT